MNRDNWRSTVITLTTRLPFTFGLVVGDAGLAMGVVCGAHGNKWGDFFQRSGGLFEGAPERLMAAYLTWRGIPLPRSLVPVGRRAKQPLVPTRRPGAYSNAAMAKMLAGGVRDHSFPAPTRRRATITSRPRSRATAATWATNVRDLEPSGASAPQNSTASTSFSPWTSAPHATLHSPHRQQATDATRTTHVLAPSGAGTP